MKVSKAIELLQEDITYTYPAKFTDLQDAIKLGIEALKRIHEWRCYPNKIPEWSLPGETPEDDTT